MKASKKLLIIAIILTIVGLIFLIPGILISVFDDKFMPIFGLITPGIFITFFSIPAWFGAFSPQLTKFNAELGNETIDYAGKEIGQVAEKTADIVSPAITKTAQAIKSGFKDNLLFCKHCGKPIDGDSKFCKHCGKEL